MRIKNIVFLLFVGFSIITMAQEIETPIKKENWYRDYVADENGNRLSGITVSVKGENISTKTNINGVFKIKASIGDIIVLSKNGETINSYVYDGRLQYEVEDNSELFSKRVKSTNESFIQVQLDSANYFKNKSPFKSISFIENALKELKFSRENSKKIGQAYEVLGDVYFNLKQFDLAINNYETSTKNLPTESVNFKLAKSYTLYSNYNKSNKILDIIIKKTPSKTLLVNSYELLSENHKNLNQLNKAIDHLKKALKVAEENGDSNRIPDLNAKLGELYGLNKNEVKAQYFYDNTIKSAQKVSPKKRAFVANSVANQYKKQQNFDKEIELKKGALQDLQKVQISEVEDSNEEGNVTEQQLDLDIGNAYAKKKSFSNAIKHLEKSKERSIKVADIETEKEAVQQLSEIYKNVGDFNKALNSYQEYVKLVDLLYKKKEQEIADAVALNRSLITQQNRISSLEKDRELLESEYKLYASEQMVSEENYKRQQLIIYSLVGGLLLLLSAIYFMYKSNKERRLSNNLLALKSLRSQMNPHFIFNALNSVNSFIAQNDERTANRYLTEFSKLMRNVLDNSEQDFIPLSKEIEMLELYMKLEHSRFKNKFDYNIEIDKDLKIGEYQIPPMLLQPYVENAVWHGLRYKEEKGNLTIQIRQNDLNSISIEISDNGIGRTKSKELKTLNQQKQQSKGMDNIKKRVAILNEMYNDKVDVFISNLNTDKTGTKVVLTLKKD